MRIGLSLTRKTDRARSGLLVVILGGCLAWPGVNAYGQVRGPVTFKTPGLIEICDVNSGPGGRPTVAWLTTAFQKGRVRYTAQVATLDVAGGLSDRASIYQVADAPKPRKGFGWNPSCPTLAPGPGKQLDVMWQRVRTSYYPGNDIIGASRPSELVRRSRGEDGKWGPIRPWFLTSRATFWTHPEGAQYFSSTGRSGVLAVQRKMRSGTGGRHLEISRRFEDGRWSSFTRERTGLLVQRLQAAFTGAAGNLAQITAVGQEAPKLWLMGPTDQQWRDPRPIPSPDGCQRTGGDQAIRLGAAPDSLWVAWPCTLEGGSFAIAALRLDWTGAVLRSQVIADNRSVEAAAVAPPAPTPYPGQSWGPKLAPAHPDVRLGAITPTATGARISWIRRAPYPSNTTYPDVYEATIDAAGTATEARVLSADALKPQLAPGESLVLSGQQTPPPAQGLYPGSDSFLLTAFPGNGDVASRPLLTFIQRNATGQWRPDFWRLPPDPNLPGETAYQAREARPITSSAGTTMLQLRGRDSTALLWSDAAT